MLAITLQWAEFEAYKDIFRVFMGFSFHRLLGWIKFTFRESSRRCAASSSFTPSLFGQILPSRRRSSWNHLDWRIQISFNSSVLIYVIGLCFYNSFEEQWSQNLHDSTWSMWKAVGLGGIVGARAAFSSWLVKDLAMYTWMKFFSRKSILKEWCIGYKCISTYVPS